MLQYQVLAPQVPGSFRALVADCTDSSASANSNTVIACVKWERGVVLVTSEMRKVLRYRSQSLVTG